MDSTHVDKRNVEKLKDPNINREYKRRIQTQFETQLDINNSSEEVWQKGRDVLKQKAKDRLVIKCLMKHHG